MASAPLSPWHGADVDCHPKSVALIIWGPAHFRVVPRTSEILGAPRHVGLEAAASEHHRSRRDLVNARAIAHHDAAYTACAVLDQPYRRALVTNLDAAVRCRIEPHPGQAD